MAKVLYLTSAMSNEDYKEYLSFWSVSPNLSNQNFHNKFVRSLAVSGPVEVISVRPINKNYQLKSLCGATREEGNITWNYIKVTSCKIDKYLNNEHRILNAVVNIVNNDSILFVDVLNQTLLKAAVKIAKKYGCKAIGVCTDNPFNISYVNSKYAPNIMSLSNRLDGYVVLTEKLAKLFNTSNKPCLVIDGLTENVDFSSDIKIEGDYLFFGGSLMRKYGVYNLIDTYQKLDNKDIKLVICGHHEEPEFKQYIKDMPGVIYLGALSYQDINYVEKHSLCAINPRPIDPQIDDYSMPSKTLEYLSNGVLTICVNNILLKKRYESAIIWAESGDTGDLLTALNKALSLTNKEKEKLISDGIRLTNQYTSLININKQINELFL